MESTDIFRNLTPEFLRDSRTCTCTCRVRKFKRDFRESGQGNCRVDDAYNSKKDIQKMKIHWKADLNNVKTTLHLNRERSEYNTGFTNSAKQCECGNYSNKCGKRSVFRYGHFRDFLTVFTLFILFPSVW